MNIRNSPVKKNKTQEENEGIEEIEDDWDRFFESVIDKEFWDKK